MRVLCKYANRDKHLHRQNSTKTSITTINIMGKTYKTPYSVGIQGERHTQKEKGQFPPQYIPVKLNLPNLMHIRTNLSVRKGQAFCCLQGVSGDDGAPIIPYLKGEAGGI